MTSLEPAGSRGDLRANVDHPARIDAGLESRSAGPEAPALDLVNHPVVAIANILAAGLMEILGQFCWAALILLFLLAEFPSNLRGGGARAEPGSVPRRTAGGATSRMIEAAVSALRFLYGASLRYASKSYRLNAFIKLLTEHGRESKG